MFCSALSLCLTVKMSTGHFFILVVMVLGKFLIKKDENEREICLNPCCNGIGEISFVGWLLSSNDCLNPCCNGIGEITTVTPYPVGFLCLNPCCNGIGEIAFAACEKNEVWVLILVVMVLGKFAACDKNEVWSDLS